METAKPVAKKAAPKKVVEPVQSTRPALRRQLEHGEKGPAVLWAQERLTELGFYEKKPDGRFGTLMAKAVRRWQESRGVKLTGVVTLKEWELL